MARTTDISGYPIFSEGEFGRAHFTAHAMLDTDMPGHGHAQLGAWLGRRRGEGSQWVHLQWHMLVFELELDLWSDAQARFDTFIRPAVGSGDAPVDAPQALWRMWLAHGHDPDLPWDAVGDAAARALPRTTDPYQALHHLLALAGAGDALTIDAWLQTPGSLATEEARLREMAHALRALAGRAWREAARLLGACLPHVDALGGSRAQNRLFHALRDACMRQARTEGQRYDEAA